LFFLEERRRHPCRINHVALLVIDVQRYFCDLHGGAYLPGVENALKKINDLIKAFEDKALPVFCTVHRGNNKMMKQWWGNSVEGQQTELSVIQKKAQIIYKDSYDAFHKTKLENCLRKEQVKQLVVCGVMTHLCVETTVRSAFVRGYEVVVAQDACWDKNDWYHFSSLKSLAHGFAVVSLADEIICMLGS